MTSDTHDVLADGMADWKRAEQALNRLIAAQRNLTRNDSDAERAGDLHQSAATAAPTAAPAEQPSSSAGRWMTVVLLAALWLSIGLIVSAAILSVAKLL